MNTFIFRSRSITLLYLIPVLLVITSCGSLYKLKSTDLHQQRINQENSVVSQETSLKGFHTTGSIFQNDSSNYWIWFQSNNPFFFHPDNGLAAENGELIVGGSRLQSKLVHESALQLSRSHKDSAAYENLEMSEKNIVKELEKERKGGSQYWLWLLGGVVALWFVARMFDDFTYKR